MAAVIVAHIPAFHTPSQGQRIGKEMRGARRLVHSHVGVSSDDLREHDVTTPITARALDRSIGILSKALRDGHGHPWRLPVLESVEEMGAPSWGQ